MIEIPFELSNVTTGIIHGYFDAKKLPESYIKIIADNTSTWREVPEYLSSFTAFTNPKVVISLDWAPIQKQFIEGFSAEETILGKVLVDAEHAGHSFSYLEIALYDLFLILNLSSPGCFDLQDVKIHGRTYNNLPDPIEFNIDGDRFDTLQCSSEEYWSIEIARIPLGDVINWYYGHSIGLRQVAKTGMERALFAVLRYCQMDAYCISELMWLRSAIGALYFNMTSAEVTAQILQDNIIIPNNANIAREFIDKLYGLSSRFMYGEYDICHPIENEFIDCNIDKDRDDLVKVSVFSLSIIIATIQKQIIKHATSV